MLYYKKMKGRDLMSYILTSSGKYFDPIAPEEKLIDLKDIAHALSLMCRANGHFSHFYSVAQHSIACAREALTRKYPSRVVFACLLHDAAEAYVCDLTRPVKKELPYYIHVEESLQELIWKHFLGTAPSSEEKALIFDIDDCMLDEEFRQLMPDEIEQRYLKLQRKVSCAFEDPQKVEEDFLALAEQVQAEL